MHIEMRPSKKSYRYRVRVAIQGYPLKTKTFAKKSEAVDWGRSLVADLSRGKLGTPQSFGISLSKAISRFKEERPPGYGEWLLDWRNHRILKWWDIVLGGFELKFEANVIRFPNRFEDSERGVEFWEEVNSILNEIRANELSLKNEP